MNMMKYDAGTGELKNWLLQENSFCAEQLGKCEAVFAQSNGYMGVRNALEETYIDQVRGTFINGTFNKAAADEMTELPNVPDMTGMAIMIGGQALNLTQGTVKDYKRVLNLKNGEVIREFTWITPENITVHMKFSRVLSCADQHVMAASVDMTADQDTTVVIDTGINGSVTNSGAQHFEELIRRVYNMRDMEYLSRTTQSGVWVAQHAACNINTEADILPVMKRRTLTEKYSFQVEKGRPVHFEKISVFHTSRDLEYENTAEEDIVETLKKDGMAKLHEAYAKAYAGIKKESEQKWKEFWDESDILIEGENEFDQLTIRFALYHLNSMVKHEDDRMGIGAKALTGEGYKGHSFWDTEMFILPFFTFTKPETAKTLLGYRYKSLYGAHLKAKEYGYEGAMYPWESAWVDDGEVTPLILGADIVTGEPTKCLTGMIEHHISADIAFAVEQYFKVTGDQEFMNERGYEIILDTALFWASRLEYAKDKDRYEICDVIGPDEYKEHVDNDVYTNYMASYNMHQALEIMDFLEKENKELYEKLDQKLNLAHVKELINSRIHKIYLPKPNKDGIVPQTDTYLDLKYLDLTKYKESKAVFGIFNDFSMEQLSEYMISKQSDLVMLMFLCDELFDRETMRKNFIFYEDKTIHDSSLSRSTHAIVATDLGMDEMAYSMYERAISVDIGQAAHSSDEGIHSASTGGIWESTVMGFGGVRMEQDMMRICPALPKPWTKLVFPLKVKGNPLKVTATKEEVTVENKGITDICIILSGEKTEIKAGTQVTKKLQEKLG